MTAISYMLSGGLFDGHAVRLGWLLLMGLWASTPAPAFAPRLPE